MSLTADQTLYAHWTAISVAGVTQNKATASLTVGGTETLTATVEPAGALDKSVTWTSDNESVAAVDSSGKVTITVTFKPVKPGKPDPSVTGMPYDDVPADTWYSTAVSYEIMEAVNPHKFMKNWDGEYWIE